MFAYNNIIVGVATLVLLGLQYFFLKNPYLQNRSCRIIICQQSLMRLKGMWSAEFAKKIPEKKEQRTLGECSRDTGISSLVNVVSVG